MEHLLATHSLALLPQGWDVAHTSSAPQERRNRETAGIELLFLGVASLLPGTLVRFHGGSDMRWQDVGDLGVTAEDPADKEQCLKVEDAALSHRPPS